jgi:nitrogen PTS system EIIA component
MRSAPRRQAYPLTPMYLNLVQIAESFGVSEKIIEDWIRREGLPHIPERGRLLFDRAQVANWATTRGLAAHAGFLAPANPALTTRWRLDALLRQGGIWRDIRAADVSATLGRVIESLPGAAPAVRQMIAQRLRATGGINIAPVGNGFALPHPSARIALGRESGTIALLLLRDPYPLAEPPLDDVPLTRMIFFVAPSPRAHLDILGRLSRVLSGGKLADILASGATDNEIHDQFRAADDTSGAPEVGHS